ncbi:hypothetical protein G5I_11022 [Acromyrmex echinatior]|uniref:Uncharacterized protein n=1 Tax=Acromyrmex echinatior TaxID=103372 RepID=F4WYH1_ACREC|nr:hypothetical protein G5I_11022 [Acromyrmex echinatior]
MEIIRFFGYLRSTVYDVTKYTVLEQSNEGSSEEELLERTHREDLRSRRKGSSADFGGPRAIVARPLLRTAAFVGMDSATLQRACKRFRPRIEAVIQAGENNCAL